MTSIKDSPLHAVNAVEAGSIAGRLRGEQRLAFFCAALLCISMFFLTGRGLAAHASRAAMLLFPVVGLLAWALLPTARQRLGASRETWLWIGAPLLAWFFTALIGMWVHGDATAVLDKPVRALIMAAGLFVWLRLRLDMVVFRHTVVLLSILGGFLAFSTAIYEHFVLGIDRVGVHAFPIQFADMTMAMTLICVVWVVGLPRSPVRVLAAVSAALSFVACWMALSRGAFVALLVLPWLIALASGTRLTVRRTVTVFAVLAVVIGVGLAASSSLRYRLGQGKADLEAYSRGHVVTSLGMRLQMWENSWHVFKAAPLLGVGSAGYMKSQERGVAEGRLDPAILEYNGAHNQFIDAFAKGGLLHGLSTLALFLCPWLWFLRRVRQPEGVPLHAIAGLALTSAFPLFALSQHVLNHSTGPMFFAGGIVLFALASGPRYGTIPAASNPPNPRASSASSASTRKKS